MLPWLKIFITSCLLMICLSTHLVFLDLRKGGEINMTTSCWINPTLSSSGVNLSRDNKFFFKNNMLQMSPCDHPINQGFAHLTIH